MRLRFLADMKIASKLSMVIGAFALGLLVFAIYAFVTIQKIKVNGPLYNEIALQKDVVADVLPPPEYIVESYLTVLQIARATNPSEMVSLISHLTELQKSYTDRHAYWSQHLPPGRLRDTLLKTSYAPGMQFYAIVKSSLIPAIEAAQSDKVTSIIDTQLTPLYNQQRAAVGQVVKMANAKLLSVQQSSVQAEQSSMTILIGAAVLALILAIVFGLVLASSIANPLKKSMEFARQLADGDLRGRLHLERKDEVGALVEMLNRLSLKLRSAIGSVQQTAERVASSSVQIAVNAERLSEGTQTQASNLEETSASVEELTTSVGLVASHAQGQASVAQQGSASMEKVQESIGQISKSLQEISEISAQSVENALEGAKTVANVMEGIKHIASSSEKIGGIINVIADIADQTNLLALNAAIEAARAGEQGRGFAVVADEVGKLAERSSMSTKEIESLIRESVASVEEGVDMAKGSQSAMEQIREASERVREMIDALKDAMATQVSSVKELSQALETVNEMSQSISASTEEQSTNARQVSRAVEDVNEVTQKAALAAEEMSASTQETSELALHLMGLATKFKVQDAKGSGLDDASNKELEGAGVLDPGQIDRAIGAHTAWKFRLREAIDTGTFDFDPNHVRRNDLCVFGRWLATLDADSLSEVEELGILENHTAFHRTAARILELVAAGKQGEANGEMSSGGTYSKISSALVGALVTLKSRILVHRHREGANEKSNGHTTNAAHAGRASSENVPFSAN